MPERLVGGVEAEDFDGTGGERYAVILQPVHPKLKRYDMDEFRGLAASAGYRIAACEVRRISRINPATLFGRGTVEDIGRRYVNGADFSAGLPRGVRPYFLVNGRLGPTRLANLRRAWGAPVIDRDLLILEIFERHASTSEAKLQIKLARLNLEKALKERLLSEELKSERQGRDFMGKGYGAHQSYRRSYKYLRKKIEEKLRRVRKERAVRRKSRIDRFNIAIIGYTNAGKTSLMNAIRRTDFRTKETAFTTVETVTRRLVHRGAELIFTDTVGFVYDIPHEIIDAFLSTLEEAAYSSLLLMVCDISDSEDRILTKLGTAFGVMNRIGAINIPTVFVFNKIDAVDREVLSARRAFIKSILAPDAPVFYISAVKKIGIVELLDYLAAVAKGIRPLPPGAAVGPSHPFGGSGSFGGGTVASSGSGADTGIGR